MLGTFQIFLKTASGRILSILSCTAYKNDEIGRKKEYITYRICLRSFLHKWQSFSVQVTIFKTKLLYNIKNYQSFKIKWSNSFPSRDVL